jgi:hypothetical protein
MPGVLVAPHVWAEGGGHLSYAFAHDIVNGLLYTRWSAGYFNWIPNLFAVVSVRALPIELAPLGVTYLAFCVQLLPVLLVLRAEGPLFTGWPRRIACLLLLLFLPSAGQEIWLNTINSQIHLGLAALIVLLDEPSRRRRWEVWGVRGILATGGLTGGYVVFLQPVFLFRAIVTRSKERWVQAAIVTAALVIQLGVVGVSTTSETMSEKRHFDITAQIFEDIAAWHFATPVLGRPISNKMLETLGTPGAYIPLLLLAGCLLWVARDRQARPWGLSDQRTTLILAYGCLAAAIAMTAFEGRLGGRYAVVPGYAIVLLVIANVRREHPRWLSTALCLALGLGLLTSMAQYWRSDGKHSPAGYSWAAEVELWRSDPKHRLAIQPKGWTLRLRPRTPNSD